MPTFRSRTNKDGSVTVHTMVRKAGYPTRTASFPNKREAAKWAATVEAEMIEGRHYKDALGRKRTLAEAIDRYTAEVLPQKRNGSMYGFTLKWWKDRHGDKRLGEVSRGWLTDCRAELLSGTFRRATPGSKRSMFPILTAAGIMPQAPSTYRRSPATCNRYMAALSHVFTMVCGDWEWLAPAANPFAGLSKLREDKGRTRHLSDDERARLLTETAKDPQLHVLVQVALATAARAGELVGLTWADVELLETEGRLVFRDTKNGETRVAWVFGEAQDLLLNHKCERQKVGTSAVFPGQWSHRRKAYGRYDYMPRFRRALNAAGITDFRFHDLRHSAATGLARLGASEQQLKAIGGWKSGIASRYVHLAAQDVKETAEAWSKRLGEKG
jgi:integrase